MPNATAKSFYPYTPSQEAALAAIIIFLIQGLVLFALTCKYGWKYMYLAASMALCESAGYGARLSSIRDPSTNTAFIVSTVVLLVVPVIVALTDYLVVSDMLAKVGKHVPILCLKIRPNVLARVFLGSDILTFFVQAIGASQFAIASTSTSYTPSQKEDLINKGKDIVLFGLVLQLAFFTAFGYIAWVGRYKNKYLLRNVPAVAPVFNAVFLSMTLLYIRGAYRVAEFAYGTDGYIFNNEWCFYAFDAIPVALAFVVFAALHFGRFLESRSADPSWLNQLKEARAAHDGASGGADPESAQCCTIGC